MSIDFDEITLILSGVKILQDLDVDIIHDIARHTQVASFDKDEIVVKAGDMGERIYFIFEGKVEVQIPDIHGDIKSRIMLKKGEVVGEISLLINSTYSADIASLATWLASDEAGFASGQCYTLDGGMTAASPLNPGLF
jgi:signal-transduction protein with cAMP-binding, CBS, and nucleotidyltransferase domain